MIPDGGVALVTGANKGLGTEVARKLARRGYVVYLGSRDLAHGRDAAADLRRAGLTVSIVKLDVTDVESVGRAAARIMQEQGRLDVLVNNAGIHVGAPALDLTVEDMRKSYETNVFGLVCVTSAMLPLLRRSTAPRIVNVASTHTVTRDPVSMPAKDDFGPAYASTKAAVTMLTVQYADALKRRPEYAHIEVKAVTVGYIATDLGRHAGSRTVEDGVQVVIEPAAVSDGGLRPETGPA